MYANTTLALIVFYKSLSVLVKFLEVLRCQYIFLVLKFDYAKIELLKKSTLKYMWNTEPVHAYTCDYCTHTMIESHVM